MKKKCLVIILLFFLINCINYQLAAGTVQEQLNEEISRVFRPSSKNLFRSIGNSYSSDRKCGTYLLRKARELSDLLYPENRYILYRPSDNLSEYYGSANVKTYESVGSEASHFIFFYTEDNTSEHKTTLDFVQKFAGYFEEAWSGIKGLNYKMPDEIVNDAKVEVYVMDISYYGMAEAQNVGLPYIFVDNDYNYSEEEIKNQDPEGSKVGLMKVVAAHEFFHVVQAGHDHWNECPGNEAVWWEENTAVWMEDYIFNEVNDYYHYLGWPFTDENDNGRWNSGEEYYVFNVTKTGGYKERGWFDYPEYSLNSRSKVIGTEKIFFEYGGVIWAKFIANYFGKSMIKTILTNIGSIVMSDYYITDYYSQDPNYTVLKAFDNSIKNVNLGLYSLSESFIQFKLANLRQDTNYDYEEGNYYPLPFHEISFPLSSNQEIRYDDILAPLSCHYLVVTGEGSINITFKGYGASFAVLVVPTTSYSSYSSSKFGSAPEFGIAQSIPLNEGQEGEYEYSFQNDPTYTKLVIIPINISWKEGTPGSYDLDIMSIEKSTQSVPQVSYSSFIRDERPVIGFSWEKGHPFDKCQIWGGLWESLSLEQEYRNYQRMVGEVDTSEDPNKTTFEDVNSNLLDSALYKYQLKFINESGVSSTDFLLIETPEIYSSPYDLNAVYTKDKTSIMVSFRVEKTIESYRIDRKIRGDTAPPKEVKSKTDIEHTDEKTDPLIEFEDDNINPDLEYIYIVYVYDTDNKEMKKEVSVQGHEKPALEKSSSDKGKCFLSSFIYP